MTTQTTQQREKNVKSLTRGTSLAKAVTKYCPAQEIGMDQVIQVIRGYERTSSDSLCHSRKEVRDVVPFNTPNHTGAVFRTFYDFEELGYDAGEGAIGYQIGAVFFRKGEREIKKIEPEFYLEGCSSLNHYGGMLAEHRLFVRKISGEKLEAIFQPDDETTLESGECARPPFRGECILDLTSKKVIFGRRR